MGKIPTSLLVKKCPVAAPRSPIGTDATGHIALNFSSQNELRGRIAGALASLILEIEKN